MVEQRLGGSFRHTDVVEMTFACVGAVDALQICLDWVAGDRERIAVVVASDIAKYELNSTGEYTQGAGAVAMLLRWNPRLLVIPRTFGVAMKSEHDFFKPIREKHKETPVFDGPFSNQCYFDRMTEAMAHFRRQAVAEKFFPEEKFVALSDRWERMIFHLPYAFHGKRIFLDEYIRERKAAGVWEEFLTKNKLDENVDDARAFTKAISKSPDYQRFVNKKLEKAQRSSGQIGNVYAASIFFALMSTFEADFAEGSKLKGKKFGFVGYGSGSKSKVFEGIVQAGWKEAAAKFRLTHRLEDRKAIDYATYEELHQNGVKKSVFPREGRFALESIGTGPTQEGARFYGILRVNGVVEVERKEVSATSMA
jgi:hydroxymethylglutaryl-CoA synthase